MVGTDSHTTMANSLGIAGWGVGGIEAVVAMLGQVDLKLNFSLDASLCPDIYVQEHI